MYYTSQNKSDCEAYNQEVIMGEGYSGTTRRWANIIEHKNGGQFAILKHESYPSDTLAETPNLDGWFEDIDI